MGWLDEVVRALNADPDASVARARLEEALRAADGAVGAAAVPDHQLVIYGTLAPGRTNHYVVADLAGSWSEGWVEGDLVEHGWGATDGFPAMVWRPGGPRIDVRLLTSAELPGHWPRLDAFEGPGYERLLIPVYRHERPPTVGSIYAARLEPSRDRP